MKNILYITIYGIFLVIVTYTITRNILYNKLEKEDTVAYIGSERVRQSEVDSLVDSKVFELREAALHNIIWNRLLSFEAKKKNISKEEFFETEIRNKLYLIKTTKVLRDSLSMKEHFSDIMDDNQSSKILLLKQREKFYFDSLITYYNYQNLNKRRYYSQIETDKLYTHTLLNNNSDVELIIISDFKCYTCYKDYFELERFYGKCPNSINVKFIPFSEYFSNITMAAEAASNQNKFKEMHEILFKNYFKLMNNEDLIYDFAAELGLDMDEFEHDINDKDRLGVLSLNKATLLNMGVFSTPTYIVNGKIIDGKSSIRLMQLEIMEIFNNSPIN